MYSLEEVYQNWPMAEDPEEHARRMQDFLDQGATRILVHSSGQQYQQRVVDFHGSEELPLLRSW